MKPSTPPPHRGKREKIIKHQDLTLHHPKQRKEEYDYGYSYPLAERLYYTDGSGTTPGSLWCRSTSHYIADECAADECTTNECTTNECAADECAADNCDRFAYGSTSPTNPGANNHGP